MAFRGGIRKSRLSKGSSRQKTRGYESMMRTLLLQNQQIIIQQQNMMFMVMKQFTNNTNTNTITQQQQQLNLQSHQDEMQQAMAATAAATSEHHLFSQQQQRPLPHQHNQAQADNNGGTPHTPSISSQSTGITSTSTTTTIAMHQHAAGIAAANVNQQQQHHHHHQSNGTQLEQQHTPGGQTDSVHRHLQQVAAHLQDNIGCYMTPASSEQDPISESKPSDSEAADELTALLEGDGLLGNNLLYNPSTDIGPITPYKHHHHNHNHHHHHHSDQHSDHQHHNNGHHNHHHETPSYYSSGCESLTTPRVEQPRQAAPVNVSQNVVKNLSNSFKSPTKTTSNINVQILSAPATREMKNSKAKIIQSMNISEFLRQVHHDNGSNGTTSSNGAAHSAAK